MRANGSDDAGATSSENGEDKDSVCSWDGDSAKAEAATPRRFILDGHLSTQLAKRDNEIQTPSVEDDNIKHRDSPIILSSEAAEDDSPPSPPPSAQPTSPLQPLPSSFFALSQDFEPDDKAPFDDEFSRFMSSQGIAPRTAEFNRQRTRAIVNELKFHYSSQQSSHDPSLSQIEREQAHRLQVYQNMCRTVNLPVPATKGACIRALRTVLVNIVDYIDEARTGRPVKVWTDFAAFRDYTLSDDKRIDRREAKADGGFLAVLLRDLTRGKKRAGSAGGGRGKRKRQRADKIVAKRACM